MNQEDVRKLMLRCARLANSDPVDTKALVALVADTLELVIGVMERQKRLASNLYQVADKAGLDRKYL